MNNVIEAGGNITKLLAPPQHFAHLCNFRLNLAELFIANFLFNAFEDFAIALVIAFLVVLWAILVLQIYHILNIDNVW